MQKKYLPILPIALVLVMLIQPGILQSDLSNKKTSTFDTMVELIEKILYRERYRFQPFTSADQKQESSVDSEGKIIDEDTRNAIYNEFDDLFNTIREEEFDQYVDEERNIVEVKRQKKLNEDSEELKLRTQERYLERAIRYALIQFWLTLKAKPEEITEGHEVEERYYNSLKEIKFKNQNQYHSDQVFIFEVFYPEYRNPADYSDPIENIKKKIKEFYEKNLQKKILSQDSGRGEYNYFNHQDCQQILSRMNGLEYNIATERLMYKYSCEIVELFMKYFLKWTIYDYKRKVIKSFGERLYEYQWENQEQDPIDQDLKILRNSFEQFKKDESSEVVQQNSPEKYTYDRKRYLKYYTKEEIESFVYHHQKSFFVNFASYNVIDGEYIDEQEQKFCKLYELRSDRGQTRENDPKFCPLWINNKK